MYKVAEDFILRTWSIETLVRKVRHGADFFIMSRGMGFVSGSGAGDEESEVFGRSDMSEDEIIDLYR